MLGAGGGLFPLEFEEYLLRVSTGHQVVIARLIEARLVDAADVGNITAVVHEPGTHS